MGKLVKTNGEEQDIAPANGSDFELKELYKLLDCSLIEVIRTPDNKLMIIDEEGKLNNKERNRKATKIMEGAIFVSDWIAGDALIINDNEFK